MELSVTNIYKLSMQIGTVNWSLNQTEGNITQVTLTNLKCSDNTLSLKNNIITNTNSSSTLYLEFTSNADIFLYITNPKQYTSYSQSPYCATGYVLTDSFSINCSTFNLYCNEKTKTGNYSGTITFNR
jgi:hypothetical protein